MHKHHLPVLSLLLHPHWKHPALLFSIIFFVLFFSLFCMLLRVALESVRQPRHERGETVKLIGDVRYDLGMTLDRTQLPP